MRTTTRARHEDCNAYRFQFQAQLEYEQEQANELRDTNEDEDCLRVCIGKC